MNDHHHHYHHPQQAQSRYQPTKPHHFIPHHQHQHQHPTASSTVTTALTASGRIPSTAAAATTATTSTTISSISHIGAHHDHHHHTAAQQRHLTELRQDDRTREDEDAEEEIVEVEEDAELEFEFDHSQHQHHPNDHNHNNNNSITSNDDSHHQHQNRQDEDQEDDPPADYGQEDRVEGISLSHQSPSHYPSLNTTNFGAQSESSSSSSSQHQQQHIGSRSTESHTSNVQELARQQDHLPHSHNSRGSLIGLGLDLMPSPPSSASSHHLHHHTQHHLHARSPHHPQQSHSHHHHQPNSPASFQSNHHSYPPPPNSLAVNSHNLFRSHQRYGHPSDCLPSPSRPLLTIGDLDPRVLSLVRAKIEIKNWDETGKVKVFFQLVKKGLSLGRAGGSGLVNGTKLLNLAGISRGKRDGILKNEKVRVVVKHGTMHLKGVWISYERALHLADFFKVTEAVYPLLIRDLDAYIAVDNQIPLPNAPSPQEPPPPQLIPKRINHSSTIDGSQINNPTSPSEIHTPLQPNSTAPHTRFQPPHLALSIDTRMFAQPIASPHHSFYHHQAPVSATLASLPSSSSSHWPLTSSSCEQNSGLVYHEPYSAPPLGNGRFDPGQTQFEYIQQHNLTNGRNPLPPGGFVEGFESQSPNPAHLANSGPRGELNSIGTAPNSTELVSSPAAAPTPTTSASYSLSFNPNPAPLPSSSQGTTGGHDYMDYTPQGNRRMSTAPGEGGGPRGAYEYGVRTGANGVGPFNNGGTTTSRSSPTLHPPPHHHHLFGTSATMVPANTTNGGFSTPAGPRSTITPSPHLNPPGAIAQHSPVLNGRNSVFEHQQFKLQTNHSSPLTSSSASSASTSTSTTSNTIVELQANDPQPHHQNPHHSIESPSGMILDAQTHHQQHMDINLDLKPPGRHQEQ